MAEPNKPGGVQSVNRALEILEAIEAAGGEMALVEMSATSGLPMPTIHRLVRTLVDRGYLRQLPDRRYALGARLIPLGSGALTAFGSRSTPQLSALVDELGETTNLATLDGDQLVYVAQVASPYAVRMFTDLGRHVHPHCRAAGKALLAELQDTQVRGILDRIGMPVMTPRTITDPDKLIHELARVRREGFALENGEMEEGVICLAVPVPSKTAMLSLSLSGPATRMNPTLRTRAVPLLQEAAREVAANLDSIPA